MADSPTVAQSTLRHRLNDIPSSVLPHVRMGFSLLSRIPPERQDKLFSYAIEDFTSNSSYDGAKVAELSGVDRNVCGDLISAIALTISAVIDLDVDKGDFFLSAPAGLLDESVGAPLNRLLDRIFESKDSLRRRSEYSRISNAVLPSYKYIDIAIDLRCKFDGEDKIIERVPVCIAYINTDSDQRLWLQFGRQELRSLIDDLSRAEKRLGSLVRVDGAA